MLTNIQNLPLKSLLAYVQDCHGLTPYDLEQRDINIKSRADVADVIECYGWAAECAAHNA